ncbi:bifunctional hydroxymethylpyrimidine kinase/phosphomethylpyrimidine kinase, partial [Sinorhizobium meliloti]
RTGAHAVLVKGGHLKGQEATDLFFDGDTLVRLPAGRIETRNDHGTGCTLSAAIAAGLAKGVPLIEAVSAAKAYLHAAISAADRLEIGQGRGPVHHFHRWWKD